MFEAVEFYVEGFKRADLGGLDEGGSNLPFLQSELANRISSDHSSLPELEP
jgi:hypothetical protein